MCQQVGSPSPVFPDEMPVHKAEEQSTNLNHLSGASAGPSPSICGYQRIPCEATLRFCFYLSVLLRLVDCRCPPNKVRISQLQRRQSAGRKQPARCPSVQAARRCTTTGGFRFVHEVWTLTATHGWRFVKLKVLLSLFKFIYLLRSFAPPFLCFSGDPGSDGGLREESETGSEGSVKKSWVGGGHLTPARGTTDAL